MKKIVALFDCDGTLYAARYGRGLIQYASEHGRKHAVRLYYAAVLPLYFLRKIKVIAEEIYQRPLVSHLAWLVKGMTADELSQASEWINKNYLLPTERPEIIKRLGWHQEQDHLIVLVSAQFLLSLETLGEHYHTHGLVGTKLEMQNARYTGRVIAPVTIGEAKDRCAREYFSTQGIEVDWQASYAYADSITDAGLFRMVGHPVVVHPAPKLFALAHRNNWEIIGTTPSRL